MRDTNRWFTILLALSFASLTAMAGCTGDQGPAGNAGAAGPQGPQGPPGGGELTAETCTLCHQAAGLVDPAAAHDTAVLTQLSKGSITITSVAIPTTGAIRPVVEFTLRDDKGATVAGFTSFNFTVAKYTPPPSEFTQGEWESYINTKVTGCTDNPAQGDFRCRQATREQTTASTTRPVGTLVDLGSGNYRYTFRTDLSLVSTSTDADGVGGNEAYTVPFEPAKIHRIGVQTGTSPPYANAVGDFLPSTATPVSPPTREVVTTAACNACHGRLTIHGRRIEVDYCVTCHNPYTFDNSGNSGDMDVMVHRLHAGGQIFPQPPVTPPPYTFAGLNPYEITYPQDVRHCTTCHQGGAQSDNWKTRTSVAACTTCHYDITFTNEAGKTPHIGGVGPDIDCILCHGAGLSLGPDTVHLIPAEEEAKAFSYTIVSVTNTAPGQTPTVVFKVTAAVDADATKKRDDIKTSPYWNQTASGASRLAVLIGWANADFQNAGSGANVGQVVSIDALAKAVADTVAGQWKVTSTVAIPAGLTGSGTVALEGHPATPTNANPASVRIPAKNASKAFAITGTSATARRSVVDIAKCNACHFNLSLHGNNRTGDVTVCTMCHNTEATDVGRRPTTGTTVDGKTQESIDFKTMIHGIHGMQLRSTGIVIYGFGGTANDFTEVTYPMPLGNCQACHKPGTYIGPVAAAFGTTTDAGADRVDGTDNLRTTKGTAVCSSCHQGGLDVSHMSQMGGAWGVTQKQIDDVNK